MTSINNQQQIQNKINYQTMSEFLENTPPNKTAYISDLAEWRAIGSYGILQARLKTPNLNLHCSTGSCNRIMTFRHFFPESDNEILAENNWRYLYISYQCSNCQKERKVFSLAAIVYRNGKPQGQCYKFGELPPYGPPVPAKLIALIGPDSDVFLQGRRCENQGLGIGAFAYYRRVVENQKNRILEKIIKVSEKIQAPKATIDTLNDATKEIQFKKALGLAKDVIPEKLFINDQNPILALHHALSVGIHELSDERCLELARDVRVVLGALSERLSSVLKDDAEVRSALSNLMNLDNS